MLFSRLSIRAMATSQVFSSSSVSKQSCKGLPEKSSLNCSAVSFFKKLTKACPRLPSPFASPGKKRKSKAAPYLLFKVDASFSRVYCVGTPLSMSKVSLEAPGSVDAKVAAGAGGMETGGGNIGIAGKFGGGRMKPVGVVGGMYVGVAGFLPRFLSPPKVFENGISLPLSSKKYGCQSGLSWSFSMNFSSRRFSMFWSRPCTRANETSATFELLKPGKQCFVFAPWNSLKNLWAAAGVLKLMNA
mmetsp:Transcript_40675/g.75687  ORF Transcript_40675/g.75687 Transcript_40675/m.75687 type:complete len:244 (+) Transcript_40675:915-1646(+)